MNEIRNRRRNLKRPPKPLDSEGLEELALAYVARYSTSAARLESYLKRKLRERGWEDRGSYDTEPDVKVISARYVELGYIDDESYARTKAEGLLGRGYGPRRVSQALYASGIGEHIREDVAPKEAQRRRAVQFMMRKRRFGSYFDGELTSDRREKQIAALLRAGHGFDHVRAVMGKHSIEAIEEWVAEAQDEEI